VNDDKIKKYKPSVVKKISAIDNSVLIHGISRTEDRSLTNLQFKLIVTFLIEHGIKNINILGAKKENEKIKKNLNNTRVSFLSDLSLQELVLELNDSIFIGVDSFPLHVADAYNANFIGLFTCTKPEAVLTNINKSIKFKKKSFSEVSPQEFVEKLEKVKAYFSK
jgi:ADP-heptose:LPS heptosyltransferase